MKIITQIITSTEVEAAISSLIEIEHKEIISVYELDPYDAKFKKTSKYKEYRLIKRNYFADIRKLNHENYRLFCGIKTYFAQFNQPTMIVPATPMTEMPTNHWAKLKKENMLEYFSRIQSNQYLTELFRVKGEKVNDI